MSNLSVPKRQKRYIRINIKIPGRNGVSVTQQSGTIKRAGRKI